MVEKFPRRRYVTYTGAVIGGGLLAGCSESADRNESSTTESGDADSEDDSYAVEMAPMGTVEFDGVPERVYTGLPYLADMAVAAGHADAIDAIYYPEYHGTLMRRFYDRLEGVSFEWEDVEDAWNADKELFYELECDVHLSDPAYAATLDWLDEGDVEEIRTNVGPWFGNYYSNRRIDPPEGWEDEYRYYTLWEIFANVAEVFDERDRYEALADVSESMRETIERNLPPEADRPTVGLVFPGENDTFWAYQLNEPGYLTAHTRPLGATDAFADLEFEGPSVQIDYEQLLEADPDVLLVLFTLSPSYDLDEIRATLESNPVAAEVSAVQEDRVYAQGVRYQGPILNLFQLEMTAKQLYPERFGEWPGHDGGEPYPEIPADERLFDRQRVSEIVTGRD